MKKAQKIFGVVLALVMCFAMSIPAFAADTGSITISNAVEGEDYAAYKMFDFTPTEDGSSGLYTIADGWANFVTGDGAAYVEVADNTVKAKENVDMAAFAKAALAYAEANSIAPAASATAETENVVFDGLALGYYVVDSSVGALCALTNTNSNATLIEKNSTPSLEKKILEDGATVDANNVAIGDTVTYQATIVVGKGAQNYVMHDKMDAGLTYTGVTSVTVNNVAVDAANYEVVTDVTDDCTFEVVFEDAYVGALDENTVITVTYTATLNENAVVGSTGNPNDAWLTYGDDNSTVKDTVITYTTKLTVNKTDDKNTPLEGAGFTLYKKDASGTYVAVGTELKGEGMTTFVWNGLEAGDYKLVETTVPEGYNKANDIEFTITCTEPETVAAATDTATWSSSKSVVTTAGAVFATTVVNSTGELLPETGGTGTTIFYIVGGLLVAGAVIILITRKRMAAEA